MARAGARPDDPTDQWIMANYYALSPDLPYGMTNERPSSLRVFAKSLHLLALGWLTGVVWLWIAQIQLSVQRYGIAPEGYGVRTLIEGLLPALLVELMGIGTDALIARAPESGDSRREWRHALLWTLFPNLFLLGMVYLIIASGSW
jgi:hypothetical protein